MSETLTVVIGQNKAAFFDQSAAVIFTNIAHVNLPLLCYLYRYVESYQNVSVSSKETDYKLMSSCPA